MNKEQVNICLSPSEIGRIKRAYNHFIQRNGFYDKDGKKRTFNTWLKDALLSQTRKELTAK